ncbi:hypothetical protein VTK73DRAFT_7338 [Phialemonium thermophilum]|uniref:CUE domain-containing protein n=1 Tax=Phialemonium thermophilum TaxID=223376 RepID=A0ABR3XSY5_9PEZI
MSVPPDINKAPHVESGPESPTTARPLEMDDDDVQESGVLGDDTAQKPGTPPAGNDSSEAPPPKPPRPLTEQQKNELILKEAFPTVEQPVIKAVLRASGGRVEQAFNALLELTDPDAAQNEREPPPPPPPPRPVTLSGATPQSQLEADELYARQLAEHYQSTGEYEARTSNRGYGPTRRRQETGLKPNELYDRDHSFLDDDLPVIKENLRKGFQETQTKVNSWFMNLKKKLDEQFDEGDDAEGKQGGSASSFIGRPSRDQSRRSADYDRYDADPELLSDDFAGMKFNSDGTPVQRQTSYTNPNRFQPPPPSKSPRSADGRKVAFSDKVDDINAYDASPKIPPKDHATPGLGGANTGGTKASKWQPLSTVDPSPIAEHDPFSLGDSDDEKDAKERTGSREIKMEDSERLKQAAAEAMADSLVDEKTKAGGSGKE